MNMKRKYSSILSMTIGGEVFSPFGFVDSDGDRGVGYTGLNCKGLICSFFRAFC